MYVFVPLLFWKLYLDTNMPRHHWVAASDDNLALVVSWESQKVFNKAKSDILNVKCKE